MASPLRLVFWETTKACNLSCKHCRAVPQRSLGSDELTTTQAFRLIDEIGKVSKPVMVLSGVARMEAEAEGRDWAEGVDEQQLLASCREELPHAVKRTYRHWKGPREQDTVAPPPADDDAAPRTLH